MVGIAAYTSEVHAIASRPCEQVSYVQYSRTTEQWNDDKKVLVDEHGDIYHFTIGTVYSIPANA